MRYLRALVLALVLSAIAASSTLDACTTFCVKAGDAVLFGRNYDFDFGRGLVMLNPSGLKKSGFEAGGPAWVARHGSLTFNQYGREFPMGGMNATGLVVELMWHDRAQYPSPDRRAPLGVLQWIQYQLDTAASVDDVLKSDAGIRIHGGVPLHYLAADASGRVAVVEFIGGRLRATTGSDLPVSALANDTYADALAYWRDRQGHRAAGSGSNARFSRAADAVSQFTATGSAAIDRAFGILGDVAQRSTRWSIVYDQTHKVVRFRTDTHAAIRSVALAAGDFDCESGASVLDVNAALAGDVRPRFERYSEARNRTLVDASYKEFTGARNTPREEIERVIAYPDRAACQAGGTTHSRR